MNQIIITATILLVIAIISLLLKIAFLLSNQVVKEGKITKLGIALIALLILLPFFLGYTARIIIKVMI